MQMRSEMIPRVLMQGLVVKWDNGSIVALVKGSEVVNLAIGQDYRNPETKDLVQRCHSGADSGADSDLDYDCDSEVAGAQILLAARSIEGHRTPGCHHYQTRSPKDGSL